jgi:hypothetical protein
MTLIAKEEGCNEQRQNSHGGQAKMGRGQSETRSVPTWSLTPTFPPYSKYPSIYLRWEVRIFQMGQVVLIVLLIDCPGGMNV